MTSAVPIPFDAPNILTAKRVTGLVVVPENQPAEIRADPLDLSWNASVAPTFETSGPPALRRRNSLSGNILLVNHPEGQKAYFLQRKMAKTTYGCVRVGFLCQQRMEEDDTGMEWDVIKSDGPYPFEMVAVKMESKEKVLGHERGLDTQDPAVELSALQMIAAHDSKGECGVIGTSIICADHSNVFIIVPFLGDGTLFQHVNESGRLSEPVARNFFQQIIKGLKTLETLGLCHRSLSLETTLRRGSTCHISNLGSSLRLSPDCSLLDPQMTSVLGNPRYLAPEILKGEVFDAYAVDLWAAGIMLCGMLFGTEAPFVCASPDDRRFKEICLKGNLHGISSKWEVDRPHKKVKTEPISDDALDLIQKMLLADPKERLSLDEVMEHPWVTAQIEVPLATTSVEKSG